MFRLMHKSPRQGSRLPWSLVLAAALSACGGGGGDGGGGGSGPPGSIDISASNRDSVTRAAMATAQGGVLGGSLGIAGNRPEPQAARGVARALVAGLHGVNQRESAAGLIGPQQVACTVSGFASVTLDDRDNNQVPSVGDVLSVSFAACSEVAGETINGSMSATYTQIVPTPLTVSATVTTSNLAVADQGFSAQIDGGFAFTLQQTGASTTTLSTVAVNALALRVTTPAYSDTFTMQDGYTIVATEDLAALPPGGGSAGRVSTTVSGKVSSAAAGGTVQVSNSEPIVQYADDDYPRSGAIEALGKTGSLRANVLSTTQVRIDIDANGDGTLDASVTVPWTQLL